MRLPELLVVVYVVAALIWGPSPSFLGVPHLLKSLYVIVLPFTAWLILTPVWRKWRPDSRIEQKLSGITIAAIAVAFFVGAGFAIQEDSHQECTEWEYEGTARDADRYCIGEIVTVPGPNRSYVWFLGIAGAISLYVCWKVISDDERNLDDATC